MNALKHITMMEELIADPSKDASVSSQEKSLSPFELIICTFKLFGVLFLLLTRGRMAKKPILLPVTLSSQFTPHDEAP